MQEYRVKAHGNPKHSEPKLRHVWVALELPEAARCSSGPPSKDGSGDARMTRPAWQHSIRTVAAARSNTWQTVRPCSCSASCPLQRDLKPRKLLPEFLAGADQTPKRGAVLFSPPLRRAVLQDADRHSLTISHRVSGIRPSPETPRSAQLQSRPPHRDVVLTLSLLLQMIQLPG